MANYLQTTMLQKTSVKDNGFFVICPLGLWLAANTPSPTQTLVPKTVLSGGNAAQTPKSHHYITATNAHLILKSNIFGGINILKKYIMNK